MVDRWEGIVRAFPSGFSSPARVMASLLINRLSRSLRQPSKNAILFMGDCVSGSRNPTIERLSRLETVSGILLSKLDDPLANVWIVEASKFNGAFACYEGFLSSMSSYGEPLSYDPENFTASQTITSLLHNCLSQVRDQLSQINHGNENLVQRKQNDTHNEICREDGQLSTPKTFLFGFSKGGVVLNQILSEISQVAQQGQGVISNHEKKEYHNGAQETSSESNTSEALCPMTSYDLLQSIVELHFLDVGLNCHGAYLTNVNLLENIVKAADMSSSGLRLKFHGTPRQWRDPLRPWIAMEKNSCFRYLRSKANENDKLMVSEKIYFEHIMPSLQMHFDILECFEVDH